MRRFGWFIVAFWPLTAMGQVPAPGPEPIPDTLASIKAEVESARKSYPEKIRKAMRTRSNAEIRAADEAHHAQIQSLIDRALTLARSHPGEPKGIAAPAWVAEMLPLIRVDKKVAERGDAAFRLLADAPALDDPEIVVGAMHGAGAVGPQCPEAEAFLRSVVSRSRNRRVVILARYFLGGYLAELARMHDRLAAPISGPELTKVLTKDRLDRLRAIDGQKLRGEAEAMLEQVIREVGNQPQTMGGQTEDELYRIRHLRIGQPAPELVGEDIDGAPIRLSDFRGKVVVLSLWVLNGYPHMPIDEGKDLVAAMKGRPFALVGVNGDAPEDRAKVKDAVTKGGITWRSFWAGGSDGAIPREWGIGRRGAYDWRTVYTIDTNGIIRDDQVGEKLTPAAFEPLVQAAEKAAR